MSSTLASYVEGVDGPWVTFVPGIGNDATFWATQASHLGTRHRTLRFDPWGCAASGPAPHLMTVDDVADGIVALWDDLGIETSSLVGLGFGGSVALLAAARHPTRVTKVVACCCRPRQPEDRRQVWLDRRASAREHGLGALGQLTVEHWLGDFAMAHPEVSARLLEAFTRNTVEGYAAYTTAFAEMDLDLSGLTTPTLLIAAQNDKGGGPVDAMQALAASLPTSELAIVADSGHIVNHEAPDAVTALLADFLAPR